MKRSALFTLLLLALCAAARAFPFSGFSTPQPKMISDADVIYNVTVESSTEGKVVPPDIGSWSTSKNEQFDVVEVRVKCKVHQTLKGKPRNEVSFTTYALHWKTSVRFWGGPPFPLPYFHKDQHCLVFFKESKDSLSNPGNRWWNKIDIPRDVWMLVKSGTPTEMVKQTLILALRKGDQSAQSEALDWLSELQDPSVIQSITPFLASDSTELAHRAMLALVRLSYLPAVKMVVEQVQKGGKIRLSHSGSSSYVEIGASSAAQELTSVKDHAAVPIIAPLLDAEEDSARWAAADAIRGLATKEDYPLLISMLDNSNPNVRSDADAALQRLTGLQKWPAAKLFRKDEKNHIDFWKDWARNGYKAA